MSSLKKVVFSEEQKRAISLFEKDLVVFAGAGSGKTLLLVERFFHALTKQRIAPENILAITFTEKAAHEMKSRLVRQCEEKGLAHLRQELENAAIGTIHSFCAKVLRENPLESGIDPLFRVLGEGEARMLVERTLDKLFEEEAGNARWLGMLADYGEGLLREALTSFYELVRASGDDASLLKCPGHKKELDRAFSELEAFVGGTRKSLDAALSPPESKLKAALETLESVFKAGEKDAGLRVARSLAVLEGLDKRSKKTKEDVERLETLLERWAALAIEEALVPVKKEFAAVFSRFRTLYESEKRKRASYDFEDLVYFVYKLFSDESPPGASVLERYRTLYSCILVDEYQDTSPLQAKIVDKLKGKNRLFFVGDSQQSIYGFRHADPWVFRRFVESGRFEKAALAHNHRSRAEILEWVNRVFAAVPDSPFRRLEAARRFVQEKPHSLELIAVRRDKEKIQDLSQARVAEARALARRLRELVDSGLRVEGPEGPRPAAYRDFAVLFRSTTSSYLYEKEFSSAGIPFYVLKGKGFYEKPEVVDILSCLEFLENPSDDIALACVLRSPLAAVSEDALFWLASSAKAKDSKAPLCGALEHLDRISGLSAEDKRRLEDFDAWIRTLRGEKDRVKLSDLVRRLVLDRNYEAKLLAEREGAQKLANVRKLTELARAFEETELAGVSDFTRYLKALSAAEVSESEASLEGGAGDAVTISTVHAAKGLEFPCVVIADMGAEKKKGGAGPVSALAGTGLGMKWLNPLTGEWLPDFTYQKAEEGRAQKEAEEDERVLYVAMTRAQEHLILSGSLPEAGKPGKTWMDKTAAILGAETLGASGILPGGIRVQIVQEMPEVPAPELQTRLADELGLREGRWNPGAVRAEGRAMDYDAKFQPPPREYTQTQDLTVSDILAASLEGPLREEIRFQEDVVDLEETEESATPRNEFGTLFHKAMEILITERPKVFPEQLFRAPFLEILSAAERKEARDSALKFWKGPLGLAVRKAKKCYPELPFIYKTKYGVLKGQIDLVFQSADGKWHLLDYKTNRLEAAGKQALAQQYEIQLKAYAFIFGRLYGEVPQSGFLYFSALDDSHEFAYGEAAFRGFGEELEKRFFEAARLKLEP